MCEGQRERDTLLNWLLPPSYLLGKTGMENNTILPNGANQNKEDIETKSPCNKTEQVCEFLLLRVIFNSVRGAHVHSSGTFKETTPTRAHTSRVNVHTQTGE